jgi:hypothetical protein
MSVGRSGTSGELAGRLLEVLKGEVEVLVAAVHPHLCPVEAQLVLHRRRRRHEMSQRTSQPLTAPRWRPSTVIVRSAASTLSAPVRRNPCSSVPGYSSITLGHRPHRPASGSTRSSADSTNEDTAALWFSPMSRCSNMYCRSSAIAHALRIPAIMLTGQRGPLTSSQRLLDELLGSGHVRDPIDRVGQLHRCRALAAWRLHAYASHSRRRLDIPDPGAPTSGPRASR